MVKINNTRIDLSSVKAYRVIRKGMLPNRTLGYAIKFCLQGSKIIEGGLTKEESEIILKELDLKFGNPLEIGSYIREKPAQ